MPWRSMALAGMATGDSELLLLVRHAEIDRAEVFDVFERRWPDMTLSAVGSISLTWNLTIEDAVEIAHAKRGVEPLRTVVLP
ncbi:hypothetical protein JMJ55_04295 [Belnapia sp. T6]|uniref:Uncharacterized protein n=1 Tax=Belnapia mucosa TaxID=2804532 RepID=A0ABS1UYI7_9PROT|nr:hypothetical protein [Belnapia mucosa]MBL6454532.1 hypothetical protein [Belnapia mucosa]